MEARGFTQQRELAEFLGVPQTSISNYLSGTDPRYESATAILKKLGRPFGGMVSEVEEEYEPRASPPTLADLKACLTGLGLSEGDIDFIMDSVAVRIDKRRRKGQGRAATA